MDTLELIHELKKEYDYNYILSIIDHFSKHAYVI